MRRTLVPLLCTLCYGGHAQLPAPAQGLAICACFQNEAEWLPEWICYHRLLGVDHFYLYNHQSTDDWAPALGPFIQRGWVTVVPLRCREYAGVNQENAYTRALAHLKDFQWVAFIDVDEFINVKKGISLKDWLGSFYSYGGVGINWRLFGTSNLAELPPGQLLIEALTRCSALSFKENEHVKSIVQPHRVTKCLSAHHFSYRPPFYAVNADRERIAGPTSSPKSNEVQINHYWTRTESWFRQMKLPRRASFGEDPSISWQRAAELNIEVDISICPKATALRRLLQEIAGH
ncbi:MAG: glycosyltransferase family 92 protein [Chlamydiia bacterium]